MEGATANDAGYLVGTVIAYLLIYGGILGLGWFIGRWLGRRRDIGFVRWPLHVAIVLALLVLLGQCAKRGEAQAAPAGRYLEARPAIG